MKQRTLRGGLIVGVLALAWYLSGLFRGVGPGNGEQGAGVPAQLQSTQPASETSPPETAASSAEAPGQGETGRLDVLISGNSYLILGERQPVPTTLDQIIDQVRRVDGDEHGIRIRILHDRTGVSGAQSDLEQALVRAGLTRDQWQTVQAPVE